MSSQHCGMRGELHCLPGTHRKERREKCFRSLWCILWLRVLWRKEGVGGTEVWEAYARGSMDSLTSTSDTPMSHTPLSRVRSLYMLNYLVIIPRLPLPDHILINSVSMSPACQSPRGNWERPLSRATGKEARACCRQ